MTYNCCGRDKKSLEQDYQDTYHPASKDDQGLPSIKVEDHADKDSERRDPDREAEVRSEATISIEKNSGGASQAPVGRDQVNQICFK